MANKATTDMGKTSLGWDKIKLVDFEHFSPPHNRCFISRTTMAENEAQI
jgi:hypothetical protein